jgi:hypothetical protein
MRVGLIGYGARGLGHAPALAAMERGHAGGRGGPAVALNF